MTPYYSDRFCQIFHGDCLGVLAGMDEASFTACVTDPPYGLEFMGKEWDHGVPGVPYWRAILRVLKPGGVLLAFGGTRTYHRMACAVEDAGFEVRDCLMWMYGSGFPKSYDVGKGIDKAAGAVRKQYAGKLDRDTRGVKFSGNAGIVCMVCGCTTVNSKGLACGHPKDAGPATPEAALWTGYGSALKPAWEPIILAMKPLEGGYARNALAHGVAGLNVDGGRIGTEQHWNPPTRKGATPALGSFENCQGEGSTVTGRWPANVILSHDPRCARVGSTPERGVQRAAGHNKFQPGSGEKDEGYTQGEGRVYGPDGEREVWDCVPGCPVRMLDEQSGVGTSPAGKITRRASGGMLQGGGHNRTFQQHGDTGGASRFFYCAKASTHERNEGQSKSNRHPTVKPLDLITYLLKLVTMPEGTRILDPFMGSGTTLRAAKELGIKAVGIDMEEEYCASSAERLSQEVLW